MIDILMATYNGEKFLDEQIQSIINQDYSEWRLFIRDDKSTDQTITIVRKYINQYPNKIFLIDDKKKGLGAKANFFELLKYSKSEYAMFADQDDIWLHNKISLTLKKMHSMEKEYGHNVPIVIHTDLTVVDEELETISQSYWELMNLNPQDNKINKSIVFNTLTGCTIMVNKAMVIELNLNTIPQNAIMHDWWIALLGSTVGRIGIIEQPTILYRQHSNNTVGANRLNRIQKIIKKINNINKFFSLYENEIKQAQAFYDLYYPRLDNQTREIISYFVQHKKFNLLKRKYYFIKFKYYYYNSPLSNLINFIRF